MFDVQVRWLALGLGAMLLLAAPAGAQAAGETPLRKADGRPDLEGFWSNASITDMQRDPSVASLVLSEQEARRLEGADYYNNRTREDAKPADPSNTRLLDGTDLLSGGGYNAFWVDPGTKVATVKGELRSSWIVEPADGRIPYRNRPQTPRTGGQAAAAPRPTGGAGADGVTVQGPGPIQRNYGSFDSYETRPIGERCLIGFGNTGGPVMSNVLYNNTYQIVQAPDHVVIVVEMVHDARIIPLTKDRKRPDAIRPWLGDSIGWYEGDALVVETRNVHPMQRGYLSPAGRLTERFIRWSEEQVVYEFTVEDPTLYDQPWRGEMAFNRAKEPPYEYACHEGNYSFAGILAGARVQEAAGGVVAAVTAEEGR